MQALAELHCHTRFSDGLASPQECVRRAARCGLQVLAITDHNTAAGALSYWQEPLQQGVLVIPGEEVSTDIGHFLAFFVRETILPGPFDRVMQEIQAQDALAFVAHPYHIPLGNRFRKKSICKATEAHLSRVVGIEIGNGHNRSSANALASRLADRLCLPAISGSDAHFPWEIGNARTELQIEELSLEAVREALQNGRTWPLPRRFNGYSHYLITAVLNRLSGKKYAWKPPESVSSLQKSS